MARCVTQEPAPSIHVPCERCGTYELRAFARCTELADGTCYWECSRCSVEADRDRLIERYRNGDLPYRVRTVRLADKMFPTHRPMLFFYTGF